MLFVSIIAYSQPTVSICDPVESTAQRNPSACDPRDNTVAVYPYIIQVYSSEIFINVSQDYFCIPGKLNRYYWNRFYFSYWEAEQALKTLKERNLVCHDAFIVKFEGILLFKQNL
jgi:hypothetical protein